MSQCAQAGLTQMRAVKEGCSWQKTAGSVDSLVKSLVRAEVTKCLDIVQILARQEEASTCGAVFGRTVCEVIHKGTRKMMLLQACDCRTCWLSFSKHGILRIIAIKCLKGPGSSSAKAHTS